MKLHRIDEGRSMPDQETTDRNRPPRPVVPQAEAPQPAARRDGTPRAEAPPGALAERPQGKLRTLWDDVDFRRLMASQLASSFGDWVGTVALLVLVLQLTGSSTAVGGILVVRLLPALLAGPIASRFVVSHSRRRTMLAMDGARTAVVLAIPLIPSLAWVFGGAFLLELCGLVFLPARDSAIPDIVSGEALPMANSLVLGSSYGTIPLGAAVYALIAWVATRAGVVTPTTLAFWFDALTFAASFLFLLRLQSPALRQGRARHGDGGEPGGVDASFLDALRIPFVRAIAPTTFVVAVGLGTLFSLGIVLVRDVLGASDIEFGLLIALFGVGAAVGMVCISRVSSPTLSMTRGLVVVQGAVVASMSLAPTIILTYAGAALFGAVTAATIASAMSVLQTNLDDRRRDLGFTAFHVLIRTGLALSALATGAAADLLRDVQWPVVGQRPSARVVLLFAGAIVMLVALLTGHVPPDAGGTDQPPRLDRASGGTL
jgi:dTMP kinase